MGFAAKASLLFLLSLIYHAGICWWRQPEIALRLPKSELNPGVLRMGENQHSAAWSEHSLRTSQNKVEITKPTLANAITLQLVFSAKLDEMIFSVKKLFC